MSYYASPHFLLGAPTCTQFSFSNQSLSVAPFLRAPLTKLLLDLLYYPLPAALCLALAPSPIRLKAGADVVASVAIIAIVTANSARLFPLLLQMQKKIQAHFLFNRCSPL